MPLLFVSAASARVALSAEDHGLVAGVIVAALLISAAVIAVILYRSEQPLRSCSVNFRRT